MWKSNLSEIKRDSLREGAELLLPHGCINWTLPKHLKKTLDERYTRMLDAVFNESRKQNPTKFQMYGHIHPKSHTI